MLLGFYINSKAWLWSW